MTTKGLLEGPKIKKRGHSTVIPAAAKLMEFAKSLEAVTKVIVGPVTPVGNGIHRLKLKRLDAGFEVMVRGGTTQQLIYIYTKDRPLVEQRLQTFWTEQYGG